MLLTLVKVTDVQSFTPFIRRLEMIPELNARKGERAHGEDILSVETQRPGT